MDVDSSGTSSIVSITNSEVFEPLNERVISLLRLLERYEIQKLFGTDTSNLKSRITDLVDSIDECLSENRLEGTPAIIIQTYTKILEYHCYNSVKLIKYLYHSLFYCDYPQLIDKLFNNGLLNNRHFDVVITSGSIFDSIHDMLEYSHSCWTLLSICLILYRINSKTYRDSIEISIRRYLVLFILDDAKNNRYLRASIKLLFKAFMLNGILNNHELIQILYKTQELHEAYLIVNSQYKTIAEKLKLKSTYSTNEFQLSLKYLTRVAIKNFLNFNYNERNVEQFEIPCELKKFLLFQNEINEINKFF